MRYLPLALLSTLLAAPAAAQLGSPAVPSGNPMSTEKALLGQALFWEEQLSSTRTMSCGSCHTPRYGGADGVSGHPEEATHPGFDLAFGTPDDVIGSPGVIRNRADGSYEPSASFGLFPQVTDRLAPPVVNAAFFDTHLLWDGASADSLIEPLTGELLIASGAALEAQVLRPLVDPVEMAHVGATWSDVNARIVSSTPLALATDLPQDLADFVDGRSYPDLFDLAFGTPDVSAGRVAMAIATYERTLVSDQSPFDLGALDASQAAGEALFFGQAGCATCHPAPLFSDGAFHNTGIRPVAEDLGRQAVTGDPADAGKFKTPSLRNAGLRPRLFHNGQFSELAEVVEFYDRGGDVHENTDPLIQPLGLTELQKADLVAFLEALSDPRVAEELAPFDRPTLYRKSDNEPYLFGECTEGTDDFAPYPIASEPPHIQNPSLTFAIQDVLGGAPAVFSMSLGAFWGGVKVAGFELFLDPSWDILSTGVVLEGAPGVAGAGFGSFSVPVDLPPSFVGLPVFQQWFILDPGAAQGIAATPGVGMQLF